MLIKAGSKRRRTREEIDIEKEIADREREEAQEAKDRCLELETQLNRERVNQQETNQYKQLI